MKADKYMLQCFMKDIREKRDILQVLNLQDLLSKINVNYKYICPICMNECESPVKSNSCNHIFCFDCLGTWLEINNKCPMCRRFIKKLLFIK